MTPPADDVDVSDLPTFAFGPSGLIWWGTFGYMVIEGTMFVVVVAAYLYLCVKSDPWPPAAPDPAFSVATANMILLLASCVPNQLAKRAAERLDLRGVRRWLTATLLLGIGAVALRAFEYPALNTRWDSSAYGSITWLLLSLHTFHLLTDVGDSVVLAVLAYTGPIEEARFVDFSENALYWYFIVGSVVPVYLLVYFGPRWL
jgi:heme/copper-type cytochrome/quinol oxidase subunit 3